MKIRSGLLACAAFLAGCFSGSAQTTFNGTDASGASSDYSFTLTSAATNLSVVVSNNATAYSYLLLKLGGTPSLTDYDWIARINGATNEINLESPQFAAGTYGLEVLTPATSTSQTFSAILTTNRTNLRSASYPVIKPLAFSTTGFLTNSGSGAWQYFQVDVPSNLLTGWRVVVSSTNAVMPVLYIRTNALPTAGSYQQTASAPTVETITFNNTQTTNATYFIGVYLPAGADSFANYILTAELASVTTLTWDPGTTAHGTQVFTNLSASGGDYFFAMTTEGTADGVWRTALNVTSGQASIYLLQGNIPSVNSYNYSSTLAGSNGFVLAQTYQFQPGQNWYYLVHATPGAQWNLVSGEAYAQQLPPLAADGSSGAPDQTMGAEGMAFFKTTISTDTLAWRLWLNGLGNQIYVKETLAPVPDNTETYDLTQPGQMLVVPTYLSPGNQYYIGVLGAPGLAFSLDSRQQAVTPLPFNSATNVNVTGYGYVTYLVQVPVQQIAWQINTLPTAGSPSVAVESNNVPNEFVNNAYSDVSGGIGNSVTLVPPGLTDGSFYVTVYGNAPYSCILTNGQPVITQTNYVFSITNDDPDRVGWRYYQVLNNGASGAEQLSSLGWGLNVSNAPAGTQLAIRRNAVPGQWNYRDNPYDNYSYNTITYEDLAGSLGFLQQPNHPADVWYVGVYSPTAALGNFVLTGFQLTGPPVAFDGSGDTIAVTDQPAGFFQYYTVTVPANAMGWDLRLTNVTSGDPQLYVCADELPSVNGNTGWDPSYNTTWPSGYQWNVGYDWTDEPDDPDGQSEYGWILAMGMGNPLQPGTYYVGILNQSSAVPMSYSFSSRGIGPGFSIPITPLAFSGGISTSNLPVRQAAYYSVIVPSNTPSWRVEMDTNVGDAMMLIQENALPDSESYDSPPFDISGGYVMNKVGDEQYLMMPNNGQSNIVAGTYYLAIVSQGTNSNPPYGVVGGGSSSYTVGSYGSLVVTNIGTVNPSGAPDLLATNGLSKSGQICAYSFTVPANTLSLEVILTNTTGTPYMTLLTGSQLPSAQDSYGVTGGQSYTWYNSTLINIPNPVATNYTLLVQAEHAGGDASYVVRVHAIGPQAVNFDGSGNTFAITNQPAGVWQYFTITVPPSAMGWDVRLTNVTYYNGQRPQMYVCRDTAPSLNNPYGWDPSYNSTWPSGYQWAPGYDWTDLAYDLDGQEEYGWILAMGMGNPLQPGNYYVGVINNSASTNLISYTLASRGIGSGFSIPVTPLNFSGGIATSNLPVREAAYYSVVVPNDTPSWRVEVDTNIGDVMLLIQENALPDSGSYDSPPFDLSGGYVMNKVGDEQYLMMPNNGQSNIVAGTYYLAVVSQGTNSNPPYGVIGGGSSSYTVGSYGSLVVTNIGAAPPDLLETNGLSKSGQICAYSFTVSPETLALEVFLTNTTGTPYMTLLTGSQLPSAQDSYGVTGGQGYTWYNSTLINIPNPVATNYTLLVQAEHAGGDASYTVRVHAIGAQPVNFDGTGNTFAITNQPAGVWQYFTITVPPSAMGWDVRLTNVTYYNGQRPQMYVCRDTAPSLNNPYGWDPSYNSTWPSGYQWAPGYDWTDLAYDLDGQEEYGWILAMGMGNPLQPGNYYVGVINNSASTNLISYTLASRGIGSGFSIPVTPLNFSGGVISNTTPLNPREADYYSVVVPTATPSWKVRLTDVSGETELLAQLGALPNSSSYDSPAYDLSGGFLMDKPGNEQYLMLPVNAQYYSNYVVAGTYYLAVVGQGVNPNFPYSIIGSNSSFYAVDSFGPQTVTNLGTVSTTDILEPAAIQGGENALYQFAIPPGILAAEVRLDNITASPYMTLQTGSYIVSPENYYGYNGGVAPTWSSPTLITLPNPTATNYSLTVQAGYGSGSYLDADFTVHVREIPVASLAFDPSLNTDSLSNSASGTLQNGQSAFYEVTVPATLNRQPVIGWSLSLTQTTGSATLRVRPGLAPDNAGCDGTSPYVPNQGIYVGPYLTPGVWYIEVLGSGVTSYTLTSASLELQRPAWTMPSPGGAVTTPGLPTTGPLFADTGVDTNGNALPGDQGIDLAEGAFNYYEIIVPPTNTAVLRTRLDAISGNPNLYIRAGLPPTLSHYTDGQCGNVVYDRSLSATSGSEYGNWVPLDGRHEAFLTNGPWYLAVEAGGNSNVRYRLRMDTGNITTIPLYGGSLTDQEMVAGDWLYYSIFIPTNAPTVWNVSFATQLGKVTMYVRDTVPPGQATAITDLRDWNNDYKNHGPYPNFPTPGTYSLTTPPLRPGVTNYLGFYASVDSTFSVSDSTNGETIDYINTLDFYGGFTTNQIVPNGFLKFRIDVPADAVEWIDTSFDPVGVNLFLDQGSAPTVTTSDDWYSSYANEGLDVSLRNSTSWPWLPGYSYFLFVTNTTASTQPFSFSMFGITPDAGIPRFLSAKLQVNDGGVVLDMSVVPGWTYDLQVSTDLINWYTIYTFTPDTTTVSYTDTTPPADYKTRFYRLVPQ